MLLLVVLLDALGAEQCFSADGTYGNLTVTTSGTCGSALSYGGITGVYMGSGTCTFTLSAAGQSVDQATLRVALTAHTFLPVPATSEEASFLLDDVLYEVTSADLDNSTPSGGVPLTATSSGSVASTGNDGRGTVSFGSVPTELSALTLSHTVLAGVPNGTIYQVCVDDAALENDADNDSISDEIEGTVNTDGQGQPDYLDLDSDNDGIPDEIEGVPNYVDLDSDDDGLLDSLEGLDDPDADGTPNYLDLDSDGDTLSDAEERALGTDWLTPDTDADGLSDPTELVTSPLDSDSDDDGLSDGAELSTDPTLFDTDDDRLSDGLELGVTQALPAGAYAGTDLAVFTPDADPLSLTDPTDDDTDDDGLLDGDEDDNGERSPSESDPTSPDTDSDSLLDGLERGLLQPQGLDTAGPFSADLDPTTTTDPADSDSDDDGLLDGDEDTSADGQRDSDEPDPLQPDTDTDGLLDGTELGLVTPSPDTDLSLFVPDADPTTTTDPLQPDTDAGGTPDGVEDLNADGQLDPAECDPNDPVDDLFCLDTDGDTLSDGTELELGTDPTRADTDGDLLEDGAEIHEHHTDPTLPDTDSGGVDDGQELANGTDPLQPTDDLPPEQDDPPDEDKTPQEDKDCGCQTSSGAGLWVLLVATLLVRRR